MTPETDENESDVQHGSPTIAGVDQIPNNSNIGHEVQSAPAAPAASGRNDTLWAGLATTVAIASMLWIAYQSNVRNEVTLVQRQIEAQHAELQSLKDKVQGMAPTQSWIDVEQSQPSISEIQGLQNHVDTLRGRAKKQKK
jgi:hypothetical protein